MMNPSFRVRRPPPLSVSHQPSPSPSAFQSHSNGEESAKLNRKHFQSESALIKSKNDPLNPIRKVLSPGIRISKFSSTTKKSGDTPTCSTPSVGKSSSHINLRKFTLTKNSHSFLKSKLEDKTIRDFKQTIIVPTSPGSTKSGAASTKSDLKDHLSQRGHDPNDPSCETFSTFQCQLKSTKSIPVLKPKKKRNFKKHPFRHLILADRVKADKILSYSLQLHRGLLYSTGCIKAPPAEIIEKRKTQIKLSKKKPKKNILVLDLDETLVWNCTGTSETPDIIVEVNEPQVQGVLKFKYRPFMKEFLKFASKNFDLVLFTASSQLYCWHVVSRIQEKHKYFRHIFTRESCLQTKNGFYIKDLRIIGGRSLDNILIIDNLVHSFGFHLDNGFPILEWRGDPDDTELLHMIDFLEPYVDADSVKELNKKKIRLMELAHIPPEELIV